MPVAVFRKGISLTYTQAQHHRKPHTTGNSRLSDADQISQFEQRMALKRSGHKVLSLGSGDDKVYFVYNEELLDLFCTLVDNDGPYLLARSPFYFDPQYGGKDRFETEVPRSSELSSF